MENKEVAKILEDVLTFGEREHPEASYVETSDNQGSSSYHDLAQHPHSSHTLKEKPTTNGNGVHRAGE